MNKKIEQMILSPKPHGKSTFAYSRFFIEGKDKSVVFKTPEGDFMSPKAIQNILNGQLDNILKWYKKHKHKDDWNMDVIYGLEKKLKGLKHE